MPALIAKGLKKSYKKRAILHGVDLEMDRGEIVGLLGPNGAGKTTCFYMVVGLVKTDAGSITLDGEDITKQPMHVRAKKGLGYLPQEASVFRKLSVRKNLMAVLEYRKDLNKAERIEKCDSLLEELQITHVSESLGISLSGGERRRVEIARALATDPSIILLDEPFAGVDPISIIEIQKIVKHLVDRNIGVLITDHNVRETLGICDRAYLLHAGKIMVSGGTDDILSNEQAKKYYLGENFSL